MSHRKHHESIDLVAYAFRQGLETQECAQVHPHRVLLFQDGDRFIAFHFHSSKTAKKRTYERFIVSREEVSNLSRVGNTPLSPQEIESLCEYHLGNREFIQHMSECYTWPEGTLAFLLHSTNSSEKKQTFTPLYIGQVYSHSLFNASDQFLSIG